MSNKKILVILGHPDHESFCGDIFDSYISGAKAGGHEVRELRLGEISFDPILHHGYRSIQELEPDLKTAQADILWANHIVVIYPTWWGAYPALLKGFFDRIILPGFGYKYNNGVPNRLLKGRTARIITTMDNYKIFNILWLCSAGIKLIKNAVFQFCGIGPTKVIIFDRVRSSVDSKKAVRLEKVKKLGMQGK